MPATWKRRGCLAANRISHYAAHQKQPRIYLVYLRLCVV